MTAVSQAEIDIIRKSGLFDEAWYLEQYPDVKALGVDPIEHYLRVGARLAREVGQFVGINEYLRANPDVARAGANPLLHYIQAGNSEGRRLPSTSGRLGGQYFVPRTKDGPYEEAVAKVIAFYLPQFHTILENDAWWGKGFTEWSNVRPALPRFPGHYQPHIPIDPGHYDLVDPSVQAKQIELARLYGVGGFCFYWYWFGGKRLLEKPLENWLANKSLDFPFCLCWANENWSRRWDGRDHDVLIAQSHSAEDDIAFIEAIAPFLRDPRYMRIKGKPLLLVYRPNLLPSPKETAARWRQWCVQNGVGEIYLSYTQSFEMVDPAGYGFDAAVEFPPNLSGPPKLTHLVKPAVKDSSLNVFDWRALPKRSEAYMPRGYKLFRSVNPGWDNTPRRKNTGTAFVNNSPALYKTWLKNAIRDSVRTATHEDERLVFVNAWNEWAEGAHLEPDARNGYAYLQATRDALTESAGILTEKQKRPTWTILFLSHDAHNAGGQRSLLDIIAWFRKHTAIRVKVACLAGGRYIDRFRALADTVVLDEALQGGGDLLKLLENFCDGVPDLVYGNTVVAGRVYDQVVQWAVPILTHVRELQSSIDLYAADCIGSVVSHSSFYIANSNAVAENLGSRYDVARSQIETIHTSISLQPNEPLSDKETRRALRAGLGLAENDFLVFGCGLGMPFRKGADLFIDVARELRDRGVKGFHLYWIGDFDRRTVDDNGRTWATYLEGISVNELQEHVTFLGARENVREYLAVGDCFLMTSREEALGRVALEAGDCALPVICFEDSGGITEFVGSEAGFMVPYENVAAMADKVQLLMADEGERIRLGRQARSKAKKHFDLDKSCRKILSVCRKVAKKKPAVSVVVPNYNYEGYLPARLDSIFSQTFRDFEVVLLDDASDDNSVDVLRRYLDFGPSVSIHLNEKNTGSPFAQWLKGIDESVSDLIWIAEADDFSDPRFLETVTPAFDNPSVRFAYCASHIIDARGQVTGNYVDGPYLQSLSAEKWRAGYEMPAEMEVSEALGIKNTVLNISSAIFRRFPISDVDRAKLSGMRMAGDWYFILKAIEGGTVAYRPEFYNYHRRHGESVIARDVQAENRVEELFRTRAFVHRHVLNVYPVGPQFGDKLESYISELWVQFCPGQSMANIEELYPLTEFRNQLRDSGHATPVPHGAS